MLPMLDDSCVAALLDEADGVAFGHHFRVCFSAENLVDAFKTKLETSIVLTANCMIVGCLRAPLPRCAALS